MPTFVQRDAPRAPRLASRAIRARADRMLALLGLDRAELSVLLTSDSVIRGLNRQHRKKNRATDVLAFPMGDAPAPRDRRLLGDVVISLDTAARQAKKRRAALLDEVTFLLAHGLLHLVGFDHRTDAEEARMAAETKKLVLAADGNRRGGARPRRAARSKVRR